MVAYGSEVTFRTNLKLAGMRLARAAGSIALAVNPKLKCPLLRKVEMSPFELADRSSDIAV